MWILVALVGAGLAPWLFVPIPAVGWVALGAIALLPFVYSAPPVRWKERGALGLLADAALAHVAPTVFAFAAFDCFGGAGTSGRPEVTILLGAVVSWSAWTGLRAIVGHEITDCERDREAGLTTWVVSVGERRARSLVTRYLLPLEVLSLAVAWAALIPIDSFAAWSFALITAGLAIGRLTGAFPAPLHAVPSSDEPRAVLLMFYRFWPAAVLAVALALRDPDLVWIPVAHFVLFFPVALGEAHSFGTAVSVITTSSWNLLRYRWWWWFHDRCWHPVRSWIRYRLPEHRRIRGPGHDPSWPERFGCSLRRPR